MEKREREREREREFEGGNTKFANSRNGAHSPKAFKSVVMFFLGSGRASAKIMGLCGLLKNRII
jgi:hypothetical protein